jgi:hypothetical protein
VPGRSHGAEGVARLARQHRIDRGAAGAGGPQRGGARSRRQHGVGVDRLQPALRHRGQQAADEGVGMGAGDLLDRRLGRLAPLQQGEGLVLQRRQHRPQPVGPLGMAGAGVVADAGRVGEEQRVHALSCLIRPCGCCSG